jgi:hypothetical protein
MFDNLMSHNIMYRFYRNIGIYRLIYLSHNRIRLDDLARQALNLAAEERKVNVLNEKK